VSTQRPGITLATKTNSSAKLWHNHGFSTKSREVYRLAVTISNLSKTYPNGVKALKSVSLNIGNNMFGLLGPNGAGKSTLMRTVAALQDPDSGSIDVDGIEFTADLTDSYDRFEPVDLSSKVRPALPPGQQQR